MAARDSQRSKVYAFGRAYETDLLPLTGCEALVRWAFSQYGETRVPRVSDGRGMRSATFVARKNQINLPLWARNKNTVLHEAAHAIVYVLFSGKELAGHGAEFMRVYVELLARARVDTLPKLRMRAREARIKVSADAACIPLAASHLTALSAARARVLSLREQLREALAEVEQLLI